ncbi:PAS domain-containing protein [bacterium AH-315-P15]|nr:PAS domain-containing protein [bacterium AH-315-P15]
MHSSPPADKKAGAAIPKLAVLGRERNRVARLTAVARSRNLSAHEAALPLCAAETGACHMLLIDAGDLTAEDRLWIRGLLGSAIGTPAIVVTESVGFEGAVELISAGVDDVLDWTTLTSASLARAVHLTLARRKATPAASADGSGTVTLLQECASALMMVDPDGIVRFANPEAEALLGVPEGSLAGAPFALELNNEAREEVLLDGHDGRQVHAQVRIVETEHGGVPMRVVTLQDMTLRRALERHFAA